MNYTEARRYVEDASVYGIVPGLSNITKLCDKLDNPQDKIKIIHIAGTNGKGSTGAFIESVLINAGLRTGRFATPAVFDYREQFKINGDKITKNQYAKYITKVSDIADKMTPHPTPFEIETAAAFLYFYSEKCDVAVIETGMGGKGDATNVISKSLVSVITSIGKDHTKFLGESIEEIAKEKAGIIKENGTVVTSYQSDDVMAVLEKECRIKNAKLIVAGKTNYKISLNGDYQRINAGVAECVCREIGISEESIKQGFLNTVWNGRFEKICREPDFIIDGAHNVNGVKALLENLDISKKRIFIIGVFKDKDYEKMAEIAAPYAETIYTVTPKGSRGLCNKELSKTFSKYNKNVKAVSLDEAVKVCLEKKDLEIVAFGSLSYLSELKRKVENFKAMERCGLILKNKTFLNQLSLIEKAESDRIYCKHGIEHLMDVARGGYIIALENGIEISKDIIYAAALVHDIGRYEQYISGKDHHIEGGKIAAKILQECGFSESEREMIVEAVVNHRKISNCINNLADIIALADKKTRMCMLCSARNTCNWGEYERNIIPEI